ncbi:hypothetical protein [Nocardioides sp.]|uniref:hypothetical protein n=1 Tax=Nocardioides sp. TaxID=35761 RepID=UPI002B2782DD|nr:hypothetical protein [Nocardioides sp.]
MAAAADLLGPADYSDTWAVLAIAGVVVVVAYYVAVLWWTRTPTQHTRPRPAPSRGARRRHLRELGAVERRVRAGQISARQGHQEISATVRGFAETMGGVPASTMTLSALRRTAPSTLTDLVESLYEPAFAGDETEAAERFDPTLDRARQVVTSWS